MLQKKDGKWILHLIEMKSKVDDKKWHEIKQKTRASYFNVCALERVLGIHIDEVEVYTTYETTGFWHSEQSEDPKIIVPLLGKPLPPKPESEWENQCGCWRNRAVSSSCRKNAADRRWEKTDR